MKTERLSIRRVKTSDWKAIQEIWIELKKSDYAQYDIPNDTEDTEVFNRITKWDSFRKSDEHIFLAVCLENLMIGYIVLHQRKNGYEIGYSFHPSYQKKGYARESISKVLEEMREKGADHFMAGTALKNIPSVKLLLDLGFQQVGTEKVTFYKDENGNDIFFDGGRFELVF